MLLCAVGYVSDYREIGRQLFAGFRRVDKLWKSCVSVCGEVPIYRNKRFMPIIRKGRMSTLESMI